VLVVAGLRVDVTSGSVAGFEHAAMTTAMTLRSIHTKVSLNLVPAVFCLEPDGGACSLMEMPRTASVDDDGGSIGNDLGHPLLLTHVR